MEKNINDKLKESNMTPPAHLASGCLLYRVLRKRSDIKNISGKFLTFFFLLGSIIPDIDGLLGKQLYNHRYTLLHAPFFWVASLIFIVFLLKYFSKNKSLLYLTIITIGSFMHIFLDWFSGRTAGIMIFYPFSTKIFSLFPLLPEKGKISVLPNKEHISFWLFYAQNKFLLFSEITLTLSALILWGKEKTTNLRQ